MKTINPKTLLLLATTLLATACSDGIETKTGEDLENAQVPKTITLKIAQPQDTRVEYTYEADILKGTWQVGDEVRVFDKNGNWIDYKVSVLTDGGKEATFQSTDHKGESFNGPFNAFYPKSRAADTYQTSLINMLGQVQTGATSTEHLKDFTVLTGEIGNITAPQSTEMQHQTAVLRFEFTDNYAKAKDLRSVTISTQDAEDITTVKCIGNAQPEKSKQLTLAVNTTDADKLVAYMAVLPGTFTQNTPIQISVAFKGNTTDVFFKKNIEGNGKEYKAGRVYNTAITIGGSASLFSAATAPVAPSPMGTGDSADSPIEIGSANNLKWMVEQINLGNHADKYFKLTTDIYIEPNNNWVPIGKTDYPFKGHFDGGGHTISGTMKAATDLDRFGFFGYVLTSGANTGSITNLHVAADINAPSIATSEDGTTFGGIAAIIDDDGFFNIENCTYTGNINVTYTGTRKEYNAVAGIVGTLNDGANRTIARCQAVGSITTTAADLYIQPGGIAGYSSAHIHTSVAAITFTGYAGNPNGQLVSYNDGTIYPCCWSPYTPLMSIGTGSTPDTCPIHPAP